MRRHSGRLQEEVAYEKRTSATLPRRCPDTFTSWNMIYCFDLYGTICAIPYFVLKFFVYHKKPNTHSECRAWSYNAWSGHLRKANNITGSPSSKYEYRLASALLRNIQNILRIWMGKKPIVSVTYENERISIKKQLTLLKMCVTSQSCVVHGSIYGRFMGFYVNLYIERKPFTQKPIKRP